MQRGDRDASTRLKISLQLPLVAEKQSTNQCDSHFRTVQSLSGHFISILVILCRDTVIVTVILVLFCCDLVIVTVISPHTTVIVGHCDGHCDSHCDLSDSIGDSKLVTQFNVSAQRSSRRSLSSKNQLQTTHT